MKKEQAEQLVEEAKEYLGQDIEIIIIDSSGDFKKNATCKFTDIASVSISVGNENPNIELYAKLEDIASGDIYRPSLKFVVIEFKRLKNLQ